MEFGKVIRVEEVDFLLPPDDPMTGQVLAGQTIKPAMRHQPQTTPAAKRGSVEEPHAVLTLW